MAESMTRKRWHSSAPRAASGRNLVLRIARARMESPRLPGETHSRWLDQFFEINDDRRSIGRLRYGLLLTYAIT